jgi:hypothetical protein
MPSGAGGSPHPVKQRGLAGDEIIRADINLKTGTAQIESLRRVRPSQDSPRTGQAYQSVQRFAAVHFSPTHLIVTSSVLGQGPRPAEVARNPTPPEPSCKQGIHGSFAGAENPNDQRGDEEGKGAAAINLSGLETIENSASRSAVMYATIMSMTRGSATRRERPGRQSAPGLRQTPGRRRPCVERRCGYTQLGKEAHNLMDIGQLPPSGLHEVLSQSPIPLR